MISIVLPCQNEEKAVPVCIKKIQNILAKIPHEIILSDSSTDNSPIIAKKLGARVIKHDQDGYGNALIHGIEAAKGKYIIMMDCDNTYDFNKIPQFIHALQKGYDFVIGDRFSGRMHKKAMPWHHKYIGNPVLSTLARWFMKTNVRDVHCGMRAFTKEAYDTLNLQTTGMEYATEMVAAVAKHKLKTKQIPIAYNPRIGESKLSSFRDGWRHLRYMLLYTPDILFLLPALYFMLFGIVGFIYFPGRLLSAAMAMSTLFGYQLLFFFVFSKIYMHNYLNQKDNRLEHLFKHLSIEKVAIVGAIIILSSVYYFTTNPLLTVTFGLIGMQTIFSAFMLSTLGIKSKKNN